MIEQKQVIPEGYKQTEVGVIPSDWSLQKLEKLTSLIIDGTHHTPTYTANGIPFLRVTDIQGKLDEDNFKYVSEHEHELLTKRCKPAKGDLLLSKNGTIGVPKVINWDWEFSVFVSLALIKLKKRLLNVEYLEQFFKSDFLNLQLAQRAKQGTVTNLHLEEIRELLIPVPPILKEQTAIANALSDVDALITELDKLIAKKQAIKTATMQQLLTGKTRLPQFALREDGTPKGYKHSELGEIPEDWGVESIDDNCRTFSGGTPSTANKGFYGGDIKWITSSDLNKGMIWDVQGRITNSGLESSAAKMIDANTFLIALYGATAGVCAISRIGAAINQAVLAVIPTSHNPTYLFYWFTKNKEEIIKTYTQGGQPNLSGDIIRAIKLPFPPNKEQTKIATILSDMDGEVLLLEQRLNKTRQIKQGMMQELLTGKTRLI